MNYEFICLQKTALAEKIAHAFHKPLHQVPLTTFADGELNIVLGNPSLFAGKIAIIVQSTGQPVNELIMAIAFLAHELKNAGAHTIIAVTPYFGYSRQERSIIAGKPGVMAVIARLLEAAGIDELVTVELHNGALHQFFSIPVHNLSVKSIFAAHIEHQCPDRRQLCLIAPDAGISAYVQALAQQLGSGMMMFEKERFAPDQTRIVKSNGHCQGTVGVIIDDIIATGGTAINVAHTLPSCGYKKIYGYFVHAVLAGTALECLQESAFTKIYVTNTLPLPTEVSPLIQQLDISPIIIDKLTQMISDKHA